MKEPLRPMAEGLARRTTRRGLFGRVSDVVFGALVGAAAGTVTRANPVTAGGRATVCVPPGPFCLCEHCNDTGVCAKPCVINTTWWASGCWVTAGPQPPTVSPATAHPKYRRTKRRPWARRRRTRSSLAASA